MSSQGHSTDPSYFLACGTGFLVVCTLVVAARFYTRIGQKARIGADDWLTLPALLLIIGCATTIIIGINDKALAYPTPPPSNPNDPSDSKSFNFTIVEQLEWSFFLMQILAMGFIKLSFVFFFRRIFVTGGSNVFRIISLAVILIIITWMLAFFFWFFFSCGTHFSSRWTTVRTLHTECPTDIKSDLALAISDFLTDVLVLILPIPMVLRLHMTSKRKAAVMAVFGLGIVAMVASIVRLAFFVYVTKLASGVLKDPKADNNLLTTESLYWSMLETGLALIACCLPTLTAIGRGTSLRDLIQSMRSLVSLRSSTSSGLRSKFRKSNTSHEPRDKWERDRSNGSITSQIAMVPSNPRDATIETFVIGDMPKMLHEGMEEGSGVIWVDTHMDQRDNSV